MSNITTLILAFLIFKMMRALFRKITLVLNILINGHFNYIFKPFWKRMSEQGENIIAFVVVILVSYCLVCKFSLKPQEIKHYFNDVVYPGLLDISNVNVYFI